MRRQLSPAQLRELRAVATRAFEARTAQRAALAALTTNRRYVSELGRKRRDIEDRQVHAHHHYNSVEERASEHSKLQAQLEEIDSRIALATAEIAAMEPRVQQLTAVSAPLNAIVERVLSYVGMNRGELGIEFEPTPQASEVIQLGSPIAGGKK